MRWEGVEEAGVAGADLVGKSVPGSWLAPAIAFRLAGAI